MEKRHLLRAYRWGMEELISVRAHNLFALTYSDSRVRLSKDTIENTQAPSSNIFRGEQNRPLSYNCEDMLRDLK